VVGGFALAALATAALTACASSPDVVQLAPGTRLLGEVRDVVTRADVDEDMLGSKVVKQLESRLREGGFTADDIDRGRVVVLREGKVLHAGDDIEWPALLPPGIEVDAGNIVEATVGTPPRIRSIRAASASQGDCRYDEVPIGLGREVFTAFATVFTLTNLEPARVATLYCKGIEAEGWARPLARWRKPPGAEGLAGDASPSETTARKATVAADDAGAEVQLTAAPGRRFRECTTCPEMVILPGGEYRMGAPHGNAPHLTESPAHRVKLRPFAIGRTHVTRAQFAAFVEETGYDAGQKCLTTEGASGWHLASNRNWRNPGFAQTEADPVTCVNWADASAYAAWLANKTGRGYRLPSEAEWEYAARAGTAGDWYWGDSRSEACRFANVDDRSMNVKVLWKPFDCSDGYAFTAPAGAFEPNAFGLHDMLGSLWQWTEDAWHENYVDAPTDGTARPGDGAKHTLRGGSWLSPPSDTRASMRSQGMAHARSHDTGFRVAAPVEAGAR
jgi:formylglycine-generating enzyme required for sulfatase activity